MSLTRKVSHTSLSPVDGLVLVASIEADKRDNNAERNAFNGMYTVDGGNKMKLMIWESERTRLQPHLSLPFLGIPAS